MRPRRASVQPRGRHRRSVVCRCAFGMSSQRGSVCKCYSILSARRCTIPRRVERAIHMANCTGRWSVCDAASAQHWTRCMGGCRRSRHGHRLAQAPAAQSWARRGRTAGACAGRPQCRGRGSARHARRRRTGSAPTCSGARAARTSSLPSRAQRVMRGRDFQRARSRDTSFPAQAGELPRELPHTALPLTLHCSQSGVPPTGVALPLRRRPISPSRAAAAPIGSGERGGARAPRRLWMKSSSAS
jgi:hypothetical protein